MFFLHCYQVFHGADSDIEWLQRDFGLYVVNLFDTHQASRALNLARHSLDHLLKHFCSVESDKRYQLADWRVRYGDDWAICVQLPSCIFINCITIIISEQL